MPKTWFKHYCDRLKNKFTRQKCGLVNRERLICDVTDDNFEQKLKPANLKIEAKALIEHLT